MTLTSRTSAQPVEYVASNAVEFTGEFNSLSNDEFSAYIADASYAGTGNQNGGGGGGGLASNPYRYGFNGKENDNEVKGDGNQQDYGMRIYDPRLGRFLSVDPLLKAYPHLTSYQYASNRPIDGVDLDGQEFVQFLAPLENAIFGTNYIQEADKKFTEGQQERIVSIVLGAGDAIKELGRKIVKGGRYGDGFTTLTLGLPENFKSPKEIIKEQLVKGVQLVKNTANEYGGLLSKTLQGDANAAGQLSVEATMFFLPEIKMGEIAEVKYMSRMVSNSAGELVERRFVNSLEDLDKLSTHYQNNLTTITDVKIDPTTGDTWTTGVNSKGEKMRIESSSGHGSTGEPAHVQVEKFDAHSGKKGRFKTESKYFYDPKEISPKKK